MAEKRVRWSYSPQDREADLEAFGCPVCFCKPCACRSIIGYCSKCDEPREDDYTCRAGGRTVLKDAGA